VILGIGLLVLMAVTYPDAGEETALVLYTTGLISLFFGLLNSRPQPPAPDPFIRPKNRASPEPVARDVSSGLNLIIVIIVVVFLFTGMIIGGIVFFLAMEEAETGPWTDEAVQWQDDMPDEILFTNQETGNAYLVNRFGDRVDISDTQYILFSGDGFQRRIGRVWINITPVAGFHITEMQYVNNGIQVTGWLSEGEELQYHYDAGLTDWTTYEPDPVTGTGLRPVTNAAAGSTIDVVGTGDGGAQVMVNNSLITTFRPPDVIDSSGKRQVFSASFDPENRILTYSPETDDMAYPLTCTLYF